MPIWDDLLTEDERKVYEIFRQPKTLGTRPAILVIDVNYAFVGRKPEHIVESVQDYRTSCGERGWEGVANIQRLLAIGREVDAACYSLYVGVIAECCFDRFQISHKVSLLDMHAKYGSVMSLTEGAEYLRTKAQPTPASRRAPESVGVR